MQVYIVTIINQYAYNKLFDERQRDNKELLMCICLITACLLNVGVISFEKDENVLALVRTGRNRKRWIIRKLLINAGIIQKSGAWFSYEGNKIGQGRENAKQFLLDNPEIREEVDRRVREHYGIVDGVKEAEASDDAKQTKAKKKADTEE